MGLGQPFVPVEMNLYRNSALFPQAPSLKQEAHIIHEWAVHLFRARKFCLGALDALPISPI